MNSRNPILLVYPEVEKTKQNQMLHADVEVIKMIEM